MKYELFAIALVVLWAMTIPTKLHAMDTSGSVDTPQATLPAPDDVDRHGGGGGGHGGGGGFHGGGGGFHGGGYHGGGYHGGGYYHGGGGYYNGGYYGGGYYPGYYDPGYGGYYGNGSSYVCTACDGVQQYCGDYDYTQGAWIDGQYQACIQ